MNNYSTARRPSDADMGAYIGAIQGPVGYNLAGIGRCVVCFGAF